MTFQGPGVGGVVSSQTKESTVAAEAVSLLCLQLADQSSRGVISLFQVPSEVD